MLVRRIPAATACVGGAKLTLSKKIGSTFCRRALDEAHAAVRTLGPLPEEEVLDVVEDLHVALDQLDEVAAEVAAEVRQLRGVVDLMQGRASDVHSPATDAVAHALAVKDAIEAADGTLEVEGFAEVLTDVTDALRAMEAEAEVLRTKRADLDALCRRAALIAASRASVDGALRISEVTRRFELPDDDVLVGLRGAELVAACKHILSDERATERVEKSRRKARIRASLEGQFAEVWPVNETAEPREAHHGV